MAVTASPAGANQLLEVRPQDFGARRDVDATNAIQACHDKCLRAGGGRIVIDDSFTCSSAIQRSQGIWRTLEFWGDNISIEFRGNGELLFPRRGLPNYRPVIIGGMGKLGANGQTLLASRCVDAPYIPISSPLARGTRRIPLKRPGTFRPGDIVYVRSGQLLAGRSAEPNAELGVVQSASAHEVVLETPLRKPYADSARFGVANVTDRVTRNFALINPRLRALESLQLLSLWSLLGFRSSGGTIDYDFLGAGARDARDVQWSTPLRHSGRISKSSYALAPSTGCTGWDAVWDVRSSGYTYLHIHEGVANSRFRGSIVNRGNCGEIHPALSIRARGWGIDIEDLVVDNGRSQQPGILVGEDVAEVRFGPVEIRSNSSTAAAIRIDTRGARFLRKPRLTGTNRRLKVVSGVGP